MDVKEDLKYTKDHEWVKLDGNIATVGITDFAQGELGDIVYVEVDTVDETLDMFVCNALFGSNSHYLEYKTGKNREIRNICKYFSWNIVKLIRIQYGPYKLGNLKEGKIEEVKVIKDA